MNSFRSPAENPQKSALARMLLGDAYTTTESDSLAADEPAQPDYSITARPGQPGQLGQPGNVPIEPAYARRSSTRLDDTTVNPVPGAFVLDAGRLSGIDSPVRITAPVATAVYAVCDAVVEAVEGSQLTMRRAAGDTVEITDIDIDPADVTAGIRVTAGTRIGRVMRTGVDLAGITLRWRSAEGLERNAYDLLIGASDPMDRPGRVPSVEDDPDVIMKHTAFTTPVARSTGRADAFALLRTAAPE